MSATQFELVQHTRVSRFLDRFEERRPVYFPQVRRTADSRAELFVELADPMLGWAESALGPDYADTLIEGYCEFVTDVNRSQIRYESARAYEAKSYEDVYRVTYDSPEFMSLYHWGVYTTTFAWAHHLDLYRFFRDEFLTRLDEHSNAGKLIDLGCGSGVWHLLALARLSGWQASAVDVSETSIALTREMCEHMAPRPDVDHIRADALSFDPGREMDAGISCFLLEHLEDPFSLLSNLARCIAPRCYAFATCALTAAEIDHIYEFRRESEVTAMAEDAGFRVVAMLSSAPDAIPQNSYYLPRSLGLVLQRRAHDIW